MTNTRPESGNHGDVSEPPPSQYRFRRRVVGLILGLGLLLWGVGPAGAADDTLAFQDDGGSEGSDPAPSGGETDDGESDGSDDGSGDDGTDSPPEPDSVPIYIWVLAGAVVLAAIAWEVASGGDDDAPES